MRISRYLHIIAYHQRVKELGKRQSGKGGRRSGGKYCIPSRRFFLILYIFSEITLELELQLENYNQLRLNIASLERRVQEWVFKQVYQLDMILYLYLTIFICPERQTVSS